MSDDPRVEQVVQVFTKEFGGRPLVVRSPGRVNIIGEHTDYNQGFVLPGALDKSMVLALAVRPDDRCTFMSLDLGQRHEATLSTLTKSFLGWPNFLLGCLSELKKGGYHIRGVDCVFSGNVPIGRGVSSSAALTTAMMLAMNEAFLLGIDRIALAKLAQQVEHNFIGVKCGIMDQFVALLGREKTVIRLDCRNLSFRYVPFVRDDIRVVLCDTQVRRQLVGSEYNTRRSQCETGVSILKRKNYNVESLRDATLEMLEASKSDMDLVVYRRCGYVIEENLRVEQACQALECGDFKELGHLMFASHEGLAKGYQVSCQELDVLVNAAAKAPGVLGARMMGAGFGGCTINLVEQARLDGFREVMSKTFRDSLHVEPVIHVCQLKGGAEVLAR
jgi:galactokinase